ncbi:YqhV family protein [Pullulanibacillus sp. KACC 23026]|uniref:YqhV family protein n=1 Tax=Pullulanibacillus sp. KACC 23026 TaxID=3028315 RepID=UPI0023AFBB3D|nr:YqhV family protein [Pullulanibacillus sp. KACC 23026]WEG12930.1 YqhV family protein [Pullulanibacillus sp. KACC 23026]
MFHEFDKAIVGMSLLRVLSGTIEITVAIFIFRLNDISKALVLNSSLALVGPCILILTTAIGVLGLAEKISFMRIFIIFAGILLILIGSRMK